jgi:hypothetical protein
MIDLEMVSSPKGKVLYFEKESLGIRGVTWC